MDLYAHSTKDLEKPWETMADHLNETARIAGNHTSTFNARELVPGMHKP